MIRAALGRGLAALAAAVILALGAAAADAAELDCGVPGAYWRFVDPQAVGLAPEPLRHLAELVRGSGVVVRHGCLAFRWGRFWASRDVASAAKPVISALLLVAVREGRIAGLDEPVARFVPELAALNGGRHAGITWRHLASQTSGYGTENVPGAAYCYNDGAIALLFDVLAERVFGESADAIFSGRFARPLGFEDWTRFRRRFEKRADRLGRLTVSPRDFARFGLLFLHGGRWGERTLVDRQLVREAVSLAVPESLPVRCEPAAAMLPDQRSISTVDRLPRIPGPGAYGLAWWVNVDGPPERRSQPALPAGAFAARGHSARRMLAVVPEWDLVISWNSGVEPWPADLEARAMALLARALGARTGAFDFDRAVP